MEYTKPTYILFAGVNGSGKSTLYNLNPALLNIPRINTDEIAKDLGDWKDVAVQINSGKRAVKLIKKYLDEVKTFNQETTLCGKSILNNIEIAKSLGYCIEVHYIGVESVDICKERIRKRVANGGHGISDKDVERRYEESFQNMKLILPICDKVYFYDNTEAFELVGISDNGCLDIRSTYIPSWFRKIVD